MKMKRFHIATIVATPIMLLAACSTQSTQSTQIPSSTAPSTTSTSSAAAPENNKVTLLAHDSFVVSEELVTKLKADTGIELEVVTGGDAGSMVAGAILTAGSPTADVMFGVDNTLVSKAANAGVFEPYTSPELENVVTALATDTVSGTVTPIDYGDVCVNMNEATLKAAGATVPTSIDQLADPALASQLVVEDPATSSPGLAFLLATINRYPDTWQEYWAKLRDGGVKVSGSWTDAYEGQYAKGRRGMVVSYATSPPAEVVYAKDPSTAKPVSTVLTDGCYRQVEYAGVLAGAANPEGARKVVDWLLSEPVQADVPLSMFVFPARDNVELPEVFAKYAAVVSNPVQFPVADVSLGLDQWLAQWSEVMGR